VTRTKAPLGDMTVSPTRIAFVAFAIPFGQ